MTFGCVTISMVARIWELGDQTGEDFDYSRGNAVVPGSIGEL